MFYKSFKIFIRNFQKQKTTGLLSMGGLSLGIAITLLIGLWCLNEMGFDKFHHQPENIYRVTSKFNIDNDTIQSASIFGIFGKEINEKFAEVEDMVRVLPLKGTLKIDQLKATENKVYAVDSTFFNFFNYHLKHGSIENFLNNPGSIIIDEQWANKYFPGKNPVGEVLSFYGDHEIAAVMYDVPSNSHLNFHALLLTHGIAKKFKLENSDGYSIYLRINKNANIAHLENKITQHIYSRFEVFKINQIKHYLQPLQNIHFSNDIRFDPAVKGDKNLMLTFLFIALIVLTIGCINFVNLFISTSFLRAKSVGIKKTNGAPKSRLISDFFLETTFYVSTSILIGVLLAEILLPVFNDLIGYNLNISFTSKELYLFLSGLFLVTILLAGTFPAFYLTRFNPVKTLKDQFKGQKISILQKILVILQFTASVVLLIAVITIRKQISFLQNLDLGFTKDQVVYIHAPENIKNDYNRIQQELLASPEIVGVTAKNCAPHEWQNGDAVYKEGDHDNQFIMEICFVKVNYFDLMDMSIIKGQNPLGSNDSLNYCVINEQAAKMLGLKNPIDSKIFIWNEPLIIKGIVKNAYTKSLHQEIEPQIYRNLPSLWNECVLLVKTTPNPKKALMAMKKMWEKEAPNYPFEYGFLVNDYESLYKGERKSGEIVSWAMLIASLITAAGLFGMARYATERRTKEIGVRKVNGAKIHEIIRMLNMDFIKWVLVAYVIACPLGWYIMNLWLKNFTQHTSISWWIFLLAGVLALTVTLITVSYQTWKAATQNPVKSLKYE